MRIQPRNASQTGLALIAVIWLVIVIVGLVAAGTITLRSHRSQMRIDFAQNSQAVLIARSGLTEGRDWLRRQTAQPVTTFAPLFAPLASPPILDTIDPEIGIVREFKISGDTWARYEVWKQWDADPDPIRLMLRQLLQCEDISAARNATGVGVVWRLRCMGYIFRRLDAGVAYDQQPNHVVAKELLEVEVQRLLLQTPGQAALNTGTGSGCQVGSNGRVEGGATAAGVYYPSGTGTPGGSGSITGTPSTAGGPVYDDGYEAVFSLPLSQLKGMASMVLSNMVDFPDPVPDGSILVVESPSMTFDSSTPLRGNGLVILVGDVTIAAGSNSSFSGFVYVDGDLTMNSPSELRGAVIVTGDVVLQGVSDFATITYDEDVVNVLRASFGNYGIASPFKRLLHADE